MPMIIVRYVTPRPRPDLRAEIAALASSLGADRLGKDPGVTAVLVEEAAPDGWFIAGRHPTEAGLATFWLDIKITAGTNLKGETTAFVKAAFVGMEKLRAAARGKLCLRARRGRRCLRLRRATPERPLGRGPPRLTGPLAAATQTPPRSAFHGSRNAATIDEGCLVRPATPA